jgi:hypothetical protein
VILVVEDTHTRIIGYRKLFWRFYWKVVKTVPDVALNWTDEETERFREKFRLEWLERFRAMNRRHGSPDTDEKGRIGG